MQLDSLAGLVIPSASALDRLVYLVGPARGGTSIIFRGLGLHPKALALDDNHFIEHVWRYRRKIHDRLWRVIFHLPTFFDYEASQRALPEEQARQLVRYVNQCFAEKRLAPLYQLYAILHALHASNTKDARSVACWCDKSNNWRGLDLLARHFPEARFVFVTRDPRAVALSHARRAGKRAAQNPVESVDTAELIKASIYWRGMMAVLRRFSRRHRHPVLWIRYEDFVSDPTASLDRLHRFAVGEVMPAAALEQAVAALAGGATNDPNERYSGISTAALERWREAMSPRELDLVAEITGRTARRLGYAVNEPVSRLGIAGLVARAGSATARIMTGVKLSLLPLLELSTYGAAAERPSD